MSRSSVLCQRYLKKSVKLAGMMPAASFERCVFLWRRAGIEVSWRPKGSEYAPLRAADCRAMFKPCIAQWMDVKAYQTCLTGRFCKKGSNQQCVGRALVISPWEGADVLRCGFSGFHLFMLILTASVRVVAPS